MSANRVTPDPEDQRELMSSGYNVNRHNQEFEMQKQDNQIIGGKNEDFNNYFAVRSSSQIHVCVYLSKHGCPAYKTVLHWVGNKTPFTRGN